MADEFFYGATLKGENAVVTWEPQDEDNFSDRPNKLIIKQLLLGVEAKADEYNVVEVETHGRDEEMIKVPIGVFKVGESRFSQCFLEFPDSPVTFRLTKGSGPVHIHGHHLIGELELDEDDVEGEGFGEEDDSENEIHAGEEEDEPKLKKPKISPNNVKAAKPEKNNKKK